MSTLELIIGMLEVAFLYWAIQVKLISITRLYASDRPLKYALVLWMNWCSIRTGFWFGSDLGDFQDD